jgi:hypothetical protein
MRDIQALVLTPIDAPAARVRDTVDRTLRESQIRPVHIDQVFTSGAVWADAIKEAVREVDLIVVDISRKNSDVLYGLGFAYSLSKPTLLLLSIDAEGEMPSSLVGYQLVTYEPGNLTSLKNQIRRFLDFQLSRWGGE